MNSAGTASDRSFQLCRLVGRLRTEFVAELESELTQRGVDLNFMQFLALKLLGDKSPRAPGELARALHYNPGAMTRLLDKLEKHGYLRRVPDPGDRRALHLELTTSGRSIRKQVIECSSAAAERVFDCISEREKDKLHDVLSRVLEHIRSNREQSVRD